MKPELMEKLRYLDHTPRHKALFLLLLRSEDYITSEILARKLEVTSRTIKSDIKYISNQLGSSEIEIVSKRSKGFLIRFENEDVKNEVKEFFQIYQAETIDTDFNRNVLYIIRRLLASECPIRMETMQEELFLNTSNYLNREIAAVKAVLNQYNLKLCSESKRGLVISGDRFNIWMCMTKMYKYFDKVIEPEFGFHRFAKFFFPQFASRKEVRKIICDVLLQTRIVFSDIYMERFVLFFILLSNVKVEEEALSDTICKIDFDYRISEEYKLVKMINQKMTDAFKNYTPCNEIQLRFLTYMAVMSTDLYRFRDCQISNYGSLVTLSEEIRGLIIRKMEEQFQIVASDDATLLKDLIKVLIPISMKIKLGISDDADLGFYTEQSMKNKPVIAQFVQEICSLINEHYGYEMSSREKHLLFNVIYEYINNIHLEHKKLRIALIAIDGRLSTQQLKFCIKKYFPSYIEKIDTKVLYELYDMDTSVYDFFFCMDYGKNMHIPYKPIFFFEEGMSDAAYYRTLQMIFLNVYDYDLFLPSVTYIKIEPKYKMNRFLVENYLAENKEYLRIETGTKKEMEIYINFEMEEESIRVFYYGNDDIGIEGKQYHIVINLDIHFNKQKFKMLLEFVDSIVEQPKLLKNNCAEGNGDIKMYFNPIR